MVKIDYKSIKQFLAEREKVSMASECRIDAIKERMYSLEIKLKYATKELDSCFP